MVSSSRSTTLLNMVSRIHQRVVSVVSHAMAHSYSAQSNWELEVKILSRMMCKSLQSTNPLVDCSATRSSFTADSLLCVTLITRSLDGGPRQWIWQLKSCLSPQSLACLVFSATTNKMRRSNGGLPITKSWLSSYSCDSSSSCLVWDWRVERALRRVSSAPLWLYSLWSTSFALQSSSIRRRGSQVRYSIRSSTTHFCA